LTNENIQINKCFRFAPRVCVGSLSVDGKCFVGDERFEVREKMLLELSMKKYICGSASVKKHLSGKKSVKNC